MKASALVVLFLPMLAFAQERIAAPNSNRPWDNSIEWPKWIDHKGQKKLVMEDGRVVAPYAKALKSQSIFPKKTASVSLGGCQCGCAVTGECNCRRCEPQIAAAKGK